MGTQRTPEEIVDVLEKLYKTQFGSKPKGKYLASRVTLRRLSGEGFLRDSLIEKVADEAMRRGLFMAPFKEDFLIISRSLVSNFRKVPKRLITELLKNDGDGEK